MDCHAAQPPAARQRSFPQVLMRKPSLPGGLRRRTLQALSTSLHRMPLFHLLPSPGDPTGRPIAASQGEGLMRSCSVAWGRVDPPRGAMSTEPRLRHARALARLEQRFGMVDHVRRFRSPDDAAPASDPANDELLLILHGRLSVITALPAAGGGLLTTWGPLEWVALPAGLARQLLPRRDNDAVEWLVLSRDGRPRRAVGPDHPVACSGGRPVPDGGAGPSVAAPLEAAGVPA